MMYTETNQGNFFNQDNSTGAGGWKPQLYPYWKDQVTCFQCPTTSLSKDPPYQASLLKKTGAYTGLDIHGNPEYDLVTVEGAYNSFGLNNFICNPRESGTEYLKLYWRSPSKAHEPDRTPMVGDHIQQANGAWPGDPGPEPGTSDVDNTDGRRFILLRIENFRFFNQNIVLVR